MLNHGALGGHRQVGHPAGRPGLRARPGAQLRAQPGGLRPALPLRARHRRRLQRLRGAARLPRGRRRGVRRRDPADPEAQQQRLALTSRQTRARRSPASVDDALRLGCAAIGYTIYPGSALRNEMYERSARAHRGGEAQGPRGGGLVVSARLRHLEGRRDRHRRRRLRGADRRPARRARHQGQAADRAHRAGRGEEGLREAQQIPIETLADRVRHVVQSAFNGRRIVIFSGGEAKGTDDSLRRGARRSATAAASARSSAATRSSARARTRSSSSIR